MILKKEVIERMSKELSLPFTGVEQDWDIEMANSKRIGSFLEFYTQNDLSNDEKIAIMALIIASYDDFLNENDLEIDTKWNEIKKILGSEKIIFNELVNYWSLNNEEDKSNLFRITPLIKSILRN